MLCRSPHACLLLYLKVLLFVRVCEGGRYSIDGATRLLRPRTDRLWIEGALLIFECDDVWPARWQLL